MSEFNIDDLDAVISNADSSLVQMLALQLKKQIGIRKASEQQLAAVVAENAGLKDFVKTCFHAAADGASLDGADIQELGERLGLFGRETYQPALHGYICGHESGEDTVYVMKKTPETDAFLAEVRAQGVDMFALMFAEEAIKSNNITTGWRAKASRAASEYAEALREDAAQLRQGAAK
ncbi:TPA: hypothetical protein ACYKTF_003577 [Enterobacter hormaechei]|nr:hypothetical protein [Enterobacter hormaechei]